MDPQIEIHDHDVPDAGTYKGHSGFVEWLKNWGDAWGEYSMEAERWINGGDKVVLLLHNRLNRRFAAAPGTRPPTQPEPGPAERPFHRL